MLFYELTYTKEFRAQLNALPEKSQRLVYEKAWALTYDPRPDGYSKKKLSAGEHLFRLRAGNYRVYYSIVGDMVAVLGVGARKDVYRKIDRLHLDRPTAPTESLSLTELIELDIEDDEPELELDESVAFLPVDWHNVEEPAQELLPRPIDTLLLEALRIPLDHWPALQACQTVDQLLTATVAVDVLERIVDAISEPDLETLQSAPKFAVTSVDDLIYDEEFDQIELLLRLDDEQLKYVNWAIAGSGPALLKGGPGTGKSIVASSPCRCADRTIATIGNRVTPYSLHHLHAGVGRIFASIDCPPRGDECERHRRTTFRRTSSGNPGSPKCQTDLHRRRAASLFCQDMPRAHWKRPRWRENEGGAQPTIAGLPLG